ncbi:hypothetical protein IJI76_01385 [Candidatus Saccharibacteria bacterium]|nr:hypothetical protein [Candidatus Saccharibacteria bacterium]
MKKAEKKLLRLMDFRLDDMNELYEKSSKKKRKKIRQKLIFQCSQRRFGSYLDEYHNLLRVSQVFNGKKYFKWQKKWQKDALRHFKKYFGKEREMWEEKICHRYLSDVEKAFKAGKFDKGEDDLIVIHGKI